MTKRTEAAYYKAMDESSLKHALGKPYTDAEAGVLIAQMAAALELFPRPPKKLLDLGCGTGWTSRFFAEAGFEVTGYDLSPEAIKLAKIDTPAHLKSQLKFVCGDFENLKLKEQFDCVLFIDALHHSEDEIAVLKEVFKVLTSGGVCLAIEPGIGHAKTPKSLEAMRKFGVTERDMPPSLTKRAAKRAGFVGIRTYPHPGQMFRALYKPAEKLPSGPKQNVARSSLLRSAALIERITLDSRRHGLVAMRKP